MKKSWICLACFVACALVLPAGCSKPKLDPASAAAKRLIGAWKGKAPMEVEVSGGKKKSKEEQKTMDMDIGCEFKKDGTATMDVLLPMSGTWEVLKVDGNKLTVKMVMEMPSFSGESKMENGKVTQTERVTTEKETQEFSIVFETDDRITMMPVDDPTQKATMVRQKK